jgi:hypothetical protein
MSKIFANGIGPGGGYSSRGVQYMKKRKKRIQKIFRLFVLCVLCDSDFYTERTGRMVNAEQEFN